jgi:hypothetical protein
MMAGGREEWVLLARFVLRLARHSNYSLSPVFALYSHR